MKLLGVPIIPHKSSELAGDLIAEATTKLLDEWGCSDQTAYMVFDTTSANTGKIPCYSDVTLKKMISCRLLHLSIQYFKASAFHYYCLLKYILSISGKKHISVYLIQTKKI